MTKGHNSRSLVREYADRIVNLNGQVKEAMEEYVKPIRENIKAVLKEAESHGLDKGVLKEAVRRYSMDKQFVAEVQVYESALLESMME